MARLVPADATATPGGGEPLVTRMRQLTADVAERCAAVEQSARDDARRSSGGGGGGGVGGAVSAVAAAAVSAAQ